MPSGTAFTKSVSGALSDVKAGETIVVRGTTADGKTTAQDITIGSANGAGGPFGFGGFGRNGGTGANGVTTATTN